MRLSTILIPDTDGEFNDELRRVEEILLALANAEDPDDPDPDPAWSPPLPIARGAAAAGALGSHSATRPPCGCSAGTAATSSSRSSRSSSTRARSPSSARPSKTLGQGLLTGHDLITETVGEWANSRRDRSGTDLVARAAQAHALLSLPGDDDTALLLTRMPTAGDWTLIPEELAAYDRHVAGFSPSGTPMTKAAPTGSTGGSTSAPDQPK